MQLERQIEDLQALQASQWFERLKQGRPEDMSAFREWCAQSPVHIREFLEIGWADHELDELDTDRQVDLDSLLREIHPGVESLRPSTLPASHNGPRHPRVRSRWRWAVAAAATAACALGLGWYGRAWLSDHQYSTGVGELRTVELVDTSVVTLNTNSDIVVDFGIGGRDVKLRHGEAVFKVARDPTRPFRVHTRVGVVQAVGTQFNVYDRAEGIDVAVLEGRVRLIPRTADASGAAIPQELTAGQEARIGLDGAIQRTQRAEVARVIAWSKRRLKFDNAPLEEIAREFNRYHENVRLRLEGISPGSITYTGIFDADDPGALARFLERESDLLVERSEREIVIRPRLAAAPGNSP